MGNFSSRGHDPQQTSADADSNQSKRRTPTISVEKQDESHSSRERNTVPKEHHRSSSDLKESSSGDGFVEFQNIESNLKTGDLVILYRKDQPQPSFAVVIDHSKCEKYFPLLLVKGRSKPIDLKKFNPMKREIRITTAATRIFYGDFERVAIRKLKIGKKIPCSDAMVAVQRVQYIPFSAQEQVFIMDAQSASQRTAIVSMFILARVYKELQVLLVNPYDLSLDTFESFLPLEEPQYIKLPPVKPGPMVTGDPPFLAQLAEGIRPMPDFPTVQYSQVIDQLQTGDLVLFSGATSSGALIKIFDGAIFSHIGIVLRPRFTKMVMVWESSTNKAGLVDIDTGKVQRGVEVVPLKDKIFSGWYDKVAIRKLKGLSDKQRHNLYQKLLEVREELHGRPYEKNQIELILSAVDVQDKYLTFLRNTEEDLSSIFCSELVAHAYQEFGLLDASKLSNEYTPDDFASHRHLKLLHGHLDEEIYIELKFDFEQNLERQESVTMSYLNFHHTQ